MKTSSTASHSVVRNPLLIAAKKRGSALVISHRCNGFGEEENSLGAFHAALASDIDGIEIDIRLTKDKRWVVQHNPHLPSLNAADSQGVRYIHQHTLSQLRTAGCMALDELLSAFAKKGKKKLLLIDVKDVGGEKLLHSLLVKYGLLRRVIVIAWEPEVLRRMIDLDKRVRIGLSYVPISRLLSKVAMSTSVPRLSHKVLLRINGCSFYDATQAIGCTHQHYLSSIPSLPLTSIQVPVQLCSVRLQKEAAARGIAIISFIVDGRKTYESLTQRTITGVLTNAPLSLTRTS